MKNKLLKLTTIISLICASITSAYAVTATYVGEKILYDASGNGIKVCIYQLPNGTKFYNQIDIYGYCAPTIEINTYQ